LGSWLEGGSSSLCSVVSLEGGGGFLILFFLGSCSESDSSVVIFFLLPLTEGFDGFLSSLSESVSFSVRLLILVVFF